MTSGARELVETLELPFESVKTLYYGTSEVRLYRNLVTNVLQIGKRVSAIGAEETIAFREAKILQSIRHDNVVPVYDVAVVDEPGIDPMIKVIEMIIPYYERGSIFDALLKGETFSIGEAVRLTRETLVGLGVLHERERLLHRDVKSGNVFIDEHGHARIGDLGLAIPMEADGCAIAAACVQMYSPPESLHLQRADRRGDIYGIGLILHELLNGPLPYADYSRDALTKRLQRRLRPVRDIHLRSFSYVPPRLRQIVTRAISREPTERFATTREMTDALDRASFVDWRRNGNVWEGAVPTNPNVRYRVVAKKLVRSDKLRLSGYKHRNRWQRCVQDCDVDDFAGQPARAFFDRLVRHATSR